MVWALVQRVGRIFWTSAKEGAAQVLKEEARERVKEAAEKLINTLLADSPDTATDTASRAVLEQTAILALLKELEPYARFNREMRQLEKNALLAVLFGGGAAAALYYIFGGGGRR